MALRADARHARIALIDDDSALAATLARRCLALGWVKENLSCPASPAQLAALRLHALVLNPELTGVDYIERVASELPALAIVAICRPVSVADRVRGLRAGADDWVTKPCHPEELIARIQAVMRRRRVAELPLEQEPIRVGELTIRPDRFDAYAGDQPAGLSRKEYELLLLLACAQGRVLEREAIYERVWGYNMVRGDRSVDVFVRKLRTKLERISPDWRYVHTHFGIGYRLAAEPAGEAACEPAGEAACEPAGEAACEPAGEAAGEPTAAPGAARRAAGVGLKPATLSAGDEALPAAAR